MVRRGQPALSTAAPTFVELAPGTLGVGSKCTVEFDDPPPSDLTPMPSEQELEGAAVRTRWSWIALVTISVRKNRTTH